MQSRDIYTIAQLAQRWQCSTDAIYDMLQATVSEPRIPRL